MPKMPSARPSTATQMTVLPWLSQACCCSISDRWVDVTAALRAQVRGDRFEAEVTNDLVRADPAPGQRKQLTVTYRWGNDRPNTVRVDDGGWLRRP